jgi:hypothetical protein
MTTERFGSLVSSICVWVILSLCCRLRGNHLHYPFKVPSGLMNITYSCLTLS